MLHFASHKATRRQCKTSNEMSSCGGARLAALDKASRRALRAPAMPNHVFASIRLCALACTLAGW